jgi:hypothetical protein
LDISIFPSFEFRSCRSTTVLPRLRFDLMALEREFVSKGQLASVAGRIDPEAAQAR